MARVDSAREKLAVREDRANNLFMEVRKGTRGREKLLISGGISLI